MTCARILEEINSGLLDLVCLSCHGQCNTCKTLNYRLVLLLLCIYTCHRCHGIWLVTRRERMPCIPAWENREQLLFQLIPCDYAPAVYADACENTVQDPRTEQEILLS